MGVIQNSVNQALGTMGAFAALGAHAAELEDSNALKKAELEGSVLGLKQEVEDIQSQQNVMLEENPALGTPAGQELLTREPATETEAQEQTELKMADRAMTRLSNQADAKNKQIKALETTYNNIGKPLIQRLKKSGGKK